MSKSPQWRHQAGKAIGGGPSAGKPEGLPGPTVEDSRPTQSERSEELKAETISRIAIAIERMAAESPEPFPSGRKTAQRAGCSPNIFSRYYRHSIYHELLVDAQKGFVERNPEYNIPADQFIDYVPKNAVEKKDGERSCFRCTCEENRRLREENDELRFQLTALSNGARPPRAKHRSNHADPT